jgi:hypothetical protein
MGKGTGQYSAKVDLPVSFCQQESLCTTWEVEIIWIMGSRPDQAKS